jgi:hypothetical protein
MENSRILPSITDFIIAVNSSQELKLWLSDRHSQQPQSLPSYIYAIFPFRLTIKCRVLNMTSFSVHRGSLNVTIFIPPPPNITR